MLLNVLPHIYCVPCMGFGEITHITDGKLPIKVSFSDAVLLDTHQESVAKT